MQLLPELCPVRRPVLFQDWCETVFAHWPYPPSTVQSVIPKCLQVQTAEGSAWVSMVIFRAAKTKPGFRSFPSFPDFLEWNLRTYVTNRHGRTGIYFFSLDSTSVATVIGARVGFGLPYYPAKIEASSLKGYQRYTAERLTGEHPRSRLEAFYQPDLAELPQSKLDFFLTQRFRLYQERGPWLTRVQVEHAPWKLWSAQGEAKCNDLLRTHHLPQGSTNPLMHWSPGVSVRIDHMRNAQ